MFERVRAGQGLRFSSREVNDWNASAEAWKNRDNQGGDAPGRPFTNPLVVWIKNNTGEYLNPFSVVAVGDPINPLDDENDNRDRAKGDVAGKGIWCNGEKPSGDGVETVCILIEAANKDEFAKAMIVGPTCCMIDVTSTGHKYAKAISGDCEKLESSETGTIKILNSVSGEGETLCYVLLGTSSAGSPSPHGIVMEAIRRTDDPTSDPADYTYGKIRVLGKEYPTKDEDGNEIEPKFDDCACLTLAVDPNGDQHQQLIKGDSVEITGPHKRKNPDYDPENEESEEPEYIEYYIALPILQYRIKIDSDIQWDMEADPPTAGNSTITRKDSDENEAVMYVSGEMVTQGYKITGNAESYIVKNEDSENGRRLFVVGGRCQQKVE